jgi:hypothetical protein
LVEPNPEPVAIAIELEEGLFKVKTSKSPYPYRLYIGSMIPQAQGERWLSFIKQPYPVWEFKSPLPQRVREWRLYYDELEKFIDLLGDKREKYLLFKKLALVSEDEWEFQSLFERAFKLFLPVLDNLPARLFLSFPNCVVELYHRLSHGKHAPFLRYGLPRIVENSRCSPDISDDTNTDKKWLERIKIQQEQEWQEIFGEAEQKFLGEMTDEEKRQYFEIKQKALGTAWFQETFQKFVSQARKIIGGKRW